MLVVEGSRAMGFPYPVDQCVGLLRGLHPWPLSVRYSVHAGIPSRRAATQAASSVQGTSAPWINNKHPSSSQTLFTPNVPTCRAVRERRCGSGGVSAPVSHHHYLQSASLIFLNVPTSTPAPPASVDTVVHMCGVDVDSTHLHHIHMYRCTWRRRCL